MMEIKINLYDEQGNLRELYTADIPKKLLDHLQATCKKTEKPKDEPAKVAVNREGKLITI